jgi:putative membrane protein
MSMSPEIQAFTNAILIALAHGALTLGLLLVGATLYVFLTPHKEIAQIRDGNGAAALSLGGVLVGLALPLALSLTASASAIEILLWGTMTIVVQLLVFRLIDIMFAGLPQRVADGEVSAAALLVSAKLAAAIILAAAVAG